MNHRFAIILPLLLFFFVDASPTQSGAGETLTLLEVRGEPEALAARLAELPVRIRLGGLGWALVEVESATLARIESELPRHRRLHEGTGPLVLLQLRDSELTREEQARLRSRTVYLDAGEDLRVIEGRAAGKPGVAPMPAEEQALAELLHDHGHIHPLPASMPARALAPLPHDALANPYRQSRLADPTARARALALAGAVDGARIESTVRTLSEGPGATRYSGRSELATYVVPLLVDSLRAIFSAPGDTVILHPFTAEVDSVEVELVNVIARRPGRSPGSGRYVIGAHYDSIARRTEGWDPATDPAPGADDNASGTSCVIEAARVLTRDSYDFDLEVALFSAEEQVLLGSQAYVADSLAQVEQVLGAIILDMVGYNPRAADSLNVLTNLTSEWLADLMQDAERALDAANGLDEFDKAVRPTLNYSDHASFWNVGASAILLIENVEIVAHNPFYHRVTDTIDNLSAVDGPDLMRRTTEVLVATLGQFATGATPEVSFVIPPTGLLFFDEGGGFAISSRVGGVIEARTQVINTGVGREDAVAAHAILEMGGRVVAEREMTFDDWGSGVVREVVIPWRATKDLVGSHAATVRLTLREGGNTIASLSGSGAFEVRPLEIVVYPNPVRRSLESGRLRVAIGGEADLRCRILNALGTEVGGLDARRLPAGISNLTLAELAGGSELPSGVYLLRMELRAAGGGPEITNQLLTFAYAK